MGVTILAVAVCAVFVFLAAWHFRMAFGKLSGESNAMPTIDGKPLFTPSRTATIAVGVALMLCAALVAATAGILRTGSSPSVLGWLCFALAAGLFARAIGEFKYVGFFKKVRGSPFARMDTLLYSPLCLGLSAAVAAVAWQATV